MTGLGGLGALVAGSALVKMLPDFTGFGDKVNKEVSGVGKKLGSVGGTLTKALTLPLAAGGIAAFKFASDVNEAMNKANTIFGNNYGVIEKWSRDSATNVGLARSEALGAASTFGDMFKQIGIGLEPTTNMSTTMVKLAADLASFHNADVTQVVEAQTAAFRGEYDSLQRFIPNINAARVEQEALAATHKKSAKDLTASEKAQAAYNIMMKDAKDASGDFAKTSGDAANKQRILTAQFKDTAASIGQRLLPIGTKLMSFVQKLLGWFDKLSPGVQTFLIILGGFVAVAGPILIMISKLVQAFQIVKAAIVGLQIASLPMILMWAAIGIAIAALVIIVIKNWDTIKNFLIGVWNAIKNAAMTVWNAIKAFFVGWFNALRAIFTTYFNVYKTIVTTVFNAVKTVILAIWNGIKTAVVAVWNAMKAAASTVWNAIKAAVVNPVIWIKDKVIGGFNAISERVGAVFRAIYDTAKRVWDWVADKIGGAMDKIGGAIGAVKDAASWLIPGSPVPFVVGLEASARAMDRLNASAQRFNATMANSSRPADKFGRPWGSDNYGADQDKPPDRFGRKWGNPEYGADPPVSVSVQIDGKEVAKAVKKQNDYDDRAGK